MLCIRNWRQAATARDVWLGKLAEAKTCLVSLKANVEREKFSDHWLKIEPFDWTVKNV